MPLSFIKYILFQWKVNELKWADLFFFMLLKSTLVSLKIREIHGEKKEKSVANLENAITSYKLVVGKWQSKTER